MKVPKKLYNETSLITLIDWINGTTERLNFLLDWVREFERQRERVTVKVQEALDGDYRRGHAAGVKAERKRIREGIAEYSYLERRDYFPMRILIAIIDGDKA